MKKKNLSYKFDNRNITHNIEKIVDIIHGELPVIKNDNYGKPETMLYGDSTNFIHVFINGEDVKTISPVFFQNMLFYNFRVEEIVS